MRKLYLLAVLTCWGLSTEAQVYYPNKDSNWERKSPAQVNMDEAKLKTAVQFAIDQENPTPRNLEIAHYQSFGKEPFGEGVGPFKERGPATGIILRHGYIVAEWGEPSRVDMTFSVTKSLLSSVVGLAYDQGLISSLDDKVGPYVGPIEPYTLDTRKKAEEIGKPYLIELFAGEHNSKITWDHLLRQTSDWEGTLWGKPEWADRPSANASEWMNRKRNEPGTVYEYNDVRVNVLALAALNVWRRPLPQVLKEYIMDPIGASPTWRWYGYQNAWIVLDGLPVQAVGGGGHWGGGMFINAYDQARFGYLTLRRGRWNDRQILSENWIRKALTPTPAQPTYGFMNWFLNTEMKHLASAPEQAYTHIGNGTNMIYVDPVNDLVIVARWIRNDAMDGLVRQVLESLKK